MNPSSPVVVSLDWLGLSLRVSQPPAAVSGHVWKEYTPTNVWGKRRMLYNESGQKVLTLLSEPRNPIIGAHAALLEVENEWLYHGGGVPMVMRLLQQAFFFEVVGISRIDLCADFSPGKSEQDVIEGLAEGRYYVQGKRNGSGFWSMNENPKIKHQDGQRRPFLAPQWVGRKIPHCQSWGHKSSDIKWKLYYKTKELLDDGGGRFLAKPYIVDKWRIAGLDISNVWRLECSLKHPNNLSMWDFRVSWDNFQNIWDVFLARLINQLFVVRKNEGHIDRTNDTIVQFLDIPKVQGRIERNQSEGVRENYARISLLRKLIVSLDDEAVYLDKYSRESCFQHIESLIRRDGLQNYFRAMTGFWLEEYRELIEQRVSSSGVFEQPQRQKMPDMKPNRTFEDGIIPEHLQNVSEDLRKEREAFERKMKELSESAKRPPNLQTKISLGLDGSAE